MKTNYISNEDPFVFTCVFVAAPRRSVLGELIHLLYQRFFENIYAGKAEISNQYGIIHAEAAATTVHRCFEKLDHCFRWQRRNNLKIMAL